MRSSSKPSPIPPPRRVKVVGSQRRVTGTNKKNPKKRKDKGELRSTSVSVRQPDASRVIVYGRTRIGGTFTFLDTGGSDPSAAMLTTGDGDSQIVWTARTPGTAGNAVSVRILVSGTNGSIIVSVVGNAITVQVKSTSGTAQSTANQVISAIQGNAPANALVRVNKGTGDGTGIVQQEAVTSLTGGGGVWLHAIHTLAWHEIESLDNVIIDDEIVTFGGSPDPRWATGRFENRVFVTYNKGTDTQAAIPDLIAQLPSKWGTNDRQAGCAHVYVICKFKDSVFPNGFPEVAFDVAGRKVYDPRDSGQSVADPSTWQFTTNAALIWADYICNYRFGCQISYLDKINEDDLIAAADICDELVVTQSGTEPRYAINGSFDTSEDPESILEEMLDAMCGVQALIEGRYSIFPGAWRAPVGDLDLSDTRSALTIRTRASMRESFNGVKGMFNNSENKQQHTDFPAVKNATYLAQDGGIEQWLDIDFGLVSTNPACQRISKIKLERIRQGITVEFTGSFELYKYRVGENVTFTVPDMGWDHKYFEIAEMELVASNDADDMKLETRIVLEETAEACFDWNDGEETVIDVAPNTTLQSPFDVNEPTDLLLESGTDQLYVRLDGTIFSRLKVSWTATDDVYTTEGGEYRIEYKLSSEGTWQHAQTISGQLTEYYILDVRDGDSYDVRVRAENGLGGVSDWVQGLNHTVVGKTEPPSEVLGFAATATKFGIDLSWDDISDVDKGEYEVRLDGTTWANATFMWRGKGTKLNLPIRTAGSYAFRIKSIDTSGNYSLLANSATTVIPSPEAPTVTYEIDGPNLLLHWTTPSAFFAIAEYQISYGASGTVIANIKGNDYSIPVTWGGARTFKVLAIDVAANSGSNGSVIATISDPNVPQNFTVTTISNNVLLDWEEPIITTLPIAYYNVFKGDTEASAVKIGQLAATFHTYIEKTGGTFTYYIQSVDTAGNVSSLVAQTGTVTEPPNYHVQTEYEPLDGYIYRYLNCIVGGNSEAPGENPDHIWLPADGSSPRASVPVLLNPTRVGQSWSNWFDENGWTSLQDAIDAGYEEWLQPTPLGPGFIEFHFDFGHVISKAFLNWTYTKFALGDDLVITPTMSISEDGVTYTDYSAATQVFAEDTRYAKLRLDWDNESPLCLIRLQDILLRLSLPEEEEFGIVAAVSTDTGGTVYTYAKPFEEIIDIQATTIGTAFGNPVVSWTANPSVLPKVLLFDAAGARISGNVGLRIKGTV